MKTGSNTRLLRFSKTRPKPKHENPDTTGRVTAATDGRDFGEFIPSDQYNRDRAAACRCEACTRCQPFGATVGLDWSVSSSEAA